MEASERKDILLEMSLSSPTSRIDSRMKRTERHSNLWKEEKSEV